MRETHPSSQGCCVVRWKEKERPYQPVVVETGSWSAALAGEARVVRRDGRGAGGRLGEWASSTWSRTDNRGRSRAAGRAGDDHLEGGEKASNRRRSRGAGGLGYLGLVFRRIHFTLLRSSAPLGGARERRIILCRFGAGGERGVSGGMVISAVGTVGGGGGAAVGDGAEVTLLGAGRVGTAVF